jgi:hypothetical protein
MGSTPDKYVCFCYGILKASSIYHPMLFV